MKNMLASIANGIMKSAQLYTIRTREEMAIHCKAAPKKDRTPPHREPEDAP
jgi:hypothetical protein